MTLPAWTECEAGRWHQSIGKGVADAAASASIMSSSVWPASRVVDPLAAAALASVGLKGVPQPRAPWVDQQVAAFQQQVKHLVSPSKTRWRGHRSTRREPNTCSYSA